MTIPLLRSPLLLVLLGAALVRAQTTPELRSPGPTVGPDGGELIVRFTAVGFSPSLFASWRIQLAGRSVTASTATTQTSAGETMVTAFFGPLAAADSGSAVISYVPAGGTTLSTPAFPLRVVAGAPEIGAERYRL